MMMMQQTRSRPIMSATVIPRDCGESCGCMVRSLMNIMTLLSLTPSVSATEPITSANRSFCQKQDPSIDRRLQQTDQRLTVIRRLWWCLVYYTGCVSVCDVRGLWFKQAFGLPQKTATFYKTGVHIHPQNGKPTLLVECRTFVAQWPLCHCNVF